MQTACSYLWRGECDTVIAGGTNVLTNPDNFAGLDRGHFLSTTGMDEHENLTLTRFLCRFAQQQYLGM